MYTPGQIQQMLDIPASTLSRYAREFREHLSPGASVTGKRRRYDEADIVILQKVRELVNDGVPFGEISARLQVLENVLSENPQENISALQMIPSVARELQRAQDTAREALALVEVLKSQIEKIPELERRLQVLENELQEYRDAPWYKRIFRR